MPQKLIVNFFDSYPQISYKRGEKILRPNEYYEHLYLLKEGFIRIYKILKTGQEITINCYNPKTQRPIIVGYSSLLKDYYIEAFTDVILKRAPKEDFHRFAEQNPSVKDHVIQDLKILFEEVLEQVQWLAIPDANTRIKMILYTLAKKIGRPHSDGLILDNCANISIKVTHNLLATLSGLSRETVTIQISKLEEQGCIEKLGNTLLIPNIEALTQDIK